MPWEADVPPGLRLAMSKDADGTAVGLLFDAANRLTGHAKLRWVDERSDEDAPDITRLVPLVLVAVAGIAAGVAGVKVAQHIRSQREEKRSERSSIASASATPAGWYEVASDATRLRYWDGTAWTNDFAQRQGAAAAMAADWYPDPSNAAQLRYWDGTAWTHHVAPKHGTAGVARQPLAAPSSERGLVSAREEPRISMSSAEWQALVRAWMTAGAAEQELWRRLSNAHISDAGRATLEAQREMEQLTPEQGANRIRLMLEAHPSMRDEFGLTEFMKFFGGGRGALGRDVPVSIERTNETRRPMEGRTLDILFLTFTRAQFSRGYMEQDVDECLDLIAANLALPLAQRTLRPEEVRAVKFRATQSDVGYDEAEVDSVLDQLAVDLGLP